MQEEREAREEREREKAAKRRMAEKKMKYAKYVKEMYWPVTAAVSDDKRLQLESGKENQRLVRGVATADKVASVRVLPSGEEEQEEKRGRMGGFNSEGEER